MKNPEGAEVWRRIAESGVKRRFVARKLGISYGYLNQITFNGGRAHFTPALRQRFADYFGVPVEELFPPKVE